MIEGDVIWCSLMPMAIFSPSERKDRKGAAAATVGLALIGAVAMVPTVDAC